MLRRLISYFKSEFYAIRNGKVFVFFVCLALATFLWFLNALEKRYTDHISVPVKYINLPKDKALVGNLPDKLEIIVDGLGYTILRHKLSIANSPILIDVNELSGNYLENKFMSKYTISTNGHKAEFAKQISNEIEIINIRPDSISFKVSNQIEKMVRIQPVVELTFAHEFILQKPPVVEPESILVKGVQEILDTIQIIETKPVEIKNLSQTVVKEIDLMIYPGLQYERDEVSVKVAVEQSTEAKFEVPVSIINHPDTLTIKTFPAKVRVICKVGVSQFNKLNENSFKATVDFAKHSGTMSKLPVTLSKVPPTAFFVDYFPKEVDYIIERKPRIK